MCSNGRNRLCSFGGSVKGDGEVLALLNEQLTSELTAINQYFLHSKLQASWGYTELAAKTRAESFEEMNHAEALTDRILLLNGLPNYQRLFSLTVGQAVREQFEADLAIEQEIVERTQLTLMDQLGDQLYLAQCLTRPPA